MKCYCLVHVCICFTWPTLLLICSMLGQTLKGTLDSEMSFIFWSTLKEEITLACFPYETY